MRNMRAHAHRIDRLPKDTVPSGPVGQLLNKSSAAAVREVVQIYVRIIDNFLEHATGLKMGRERRSDAVPVNVEGSFPETVRDFIERQPLANATHLKQWADECGFIECIQKFESDILGEYRAENGAIYLYWPVISMVSAGLDLDEQQVALVTLAHEYAHAYSHQGQDIDARSWSIKEYETLDTQLKEELAQYYTDLFCRSFYKEEHNLPTTFDKLLSCQNSIYRGYVDWIIPPAQNGELIRAAIIKARSTKVTSAVKFRACVVDATKFYL